MIHYHGTPVSGKRSDALAFITGRHVLIPFPSPQDLGCAIEVAASFCIDNGAFTVWKKGGTLDVDGYFKFVESCQRAPGFDFALMPDVIDGTAEENQKLIARWPFRHGTGVPVWHLHEPTDWLRFLVGAYPRVALGSSGQWSTPGQPNWWRRMTEAMSQITDEHGAPLCKLHGLRMLNPEIFQHLPLASADSTNAVRNGNLFTRFGMYPPMTVGQRQVIIANRIEAQQSPPAWKMPKAWKEGVLWEWAEKQQQVNETGEAEKQTMELPVVFDDTKQEE